MVLSFLLNLYVYGSTCRFFRYGLYRDRTRFSVDYAARTFFRAQAAVFTLVIIDNRMIINNMYRVKMTRLLAQLTADTALMAVVVYILAKLGVGA